MQHKWNNLIFSLLLLGSLALFPYYLGIWDQKVALYETGTGTCHVTDTPVRSLPKQDQQALERGIPLESPQAAAAALEDFGS